MSTELGLFNKAWLVWHTICLSSSARDVTPPMTTPDRMWCDFDLFLNPPIMLGCQEIVVAWFLNNPETKISCLFGVKFAFNEHFLLNFLMKERSILTTFLKSCHLICFSLVFFAWILSNASSSQHERTWKSEQFPTECKTYLFVFTISREVALKGLGHAI